MAYPVSIIKEKLAKFDYWVRCIDWAVEAVILQGKWKPTLK